MLLDVQRKSGIYITGIWNQVFIFYVHVFGNFIKIGQKNKFYDMFSHTKLIKHENYVTRNTKDNVG